MNTSIQTGSRKGRLNYGIDFKKRLAIAACEPGVSVARIALDHGINANMLHKWRRAHLAGALGTVKYSQQEFLPVRVVRSKNTLVPSPAHTPSRLAQITATNLPVSRLGVIEIRVGAAIVRMEGAVDTATLEQVLRHLHP